MSPPLPRLLPVLFACLPLTGLAAPRADWNIRDHIPLEKVIIQGHRGVGALAEENMIEAFELAWRMGIHPESDLRMTKASVVFQTLPYTADPSVHAKLLDLGVVSFATDHPDVTLRELKAYYAAKPSSRQL